MALTCSMHEGNFLRQLFSDISGNVKKCVTLYADNQGAITLAKSNWPEIQTYRIPSYRDPSSEIQTYRIIDIKYHFIRSEFKMVLLN